MVAPPCCPVAPTTATTPDSSAFFSAHGLLIAALDRIGESGRTGAPAVQAYLKECLRLGDQLGLPLRGAPPLTDPTSIDARGRINHALERFLADGRAQGAVRADVNATDVIACGAMITHPLSHGRVSASIASRHVALFVHGLQATDARDLPAPPITREEVETALAANAVGRRAGGG
ncbi:hypothetical protein [Mycolicibacterium hodleri]|uniref:Transcriptional regulator SbtR-like C-terminal domain-containing protein n=1 Tax=Mycolicibacterium hodleri TaxID=49897 RepID=A0A502E2Y4_9MYCO|nr:hypothetical protein [Mycolicibacterium hodleri]TPG31887.1 hypothetical protein EAH80_21180 [Mycolicibacterium hodleri]